MKCPEASSDHVPPKFMMQLHHILLLSSVGQYTLSQYTHSATPSMSSSEHPKRPGQTSGLRPSLQPHLLAGVVGAFCYASLFSLLCMVAMLWSSCSSKKNLHSWVQVVSQPGYSLLISNRYNQDGRILLATLFEHPFLGQIALVSLPAWQKSPYWRRYYLFRSKNVKCTLYKFQFKTNRVTWISVLLSWC